MTGRRRLGDVYEVASFLLEDLKDMFFVDEIELTLIARLPGDVEADLVVTSDSLDELAKLIERRREKALRSMQQSVPMLVFGGAPEEET